MHDLCSVCILSDWYRVLYVHSVVSEYDYRVVNKIPPVHDLLLHVTSYLSLSIVLQLVHNEW